MILNFNDGSLDMSQYSYPFTIINALGNDTDPNREQATWLVDTETGECKAFSKDERGNFVYNSNGEIASHTFLYIPTPLKVYDGNGKLVTMPPNVIDPVTLRSVFDGTGLRELILNKAARAVSAHVEEIILGDDLPQPDAILQTKETL